MKIILLKNKENRNLSNACSIMEHTDKINIIIDFDAMKDFSSGHFCTGPCPVGRGPWTVDPGARGPGEYRPQGFCGWRRAAAMIYTECAAYLMLNNNLTKRRRGMFPHNQRALPSAPRDWDWD